jgi:hypothetical protein
MTNPSTPEATAIRHWHWLQTADGVVLIGSTEPFGDVARAIADAMVTATTGGDLRAEVDALKHAIECIGGAVMRHESLTDLKAAIADILDAQEEKREDATAVSAATEAHGEAGGAEDA